VLLYQKKMLANKALLINKEKDHQKKLLDATLEIGERERRKIAANLHDDIGINLNVLKINLSRLQRPNSTKEDREDIFVQSKEIIDGSIDTVRTIYNDILPPTLMNLGFIKGLREICRQLNVSGTCEVKFDPSIPDIDFDKNTQLQLYRIVKEVLNNTIRHAKPSFIEINIENTENNLLVIILHNGISITTEKIKKLAETSTGIGLKSILTRTELINAAIDFTQTDSGMAKVMIDVKL
jgi:signal transduction histidine kinase